MARGVCDDSVLFHGSFNGFSAITNEWDNMNELNGEKLIKITHAISLALEEQ